MGSRIMVLFSLIPFVIFGVEIFEGGGEGRGRKTNYLI